MANKDEIIQSIQAALDARSRRVVNRNAVEALFGAVADPVGALGRIFLGRDSALGAERQRITQDVILDLLCKIDDSITQTKGALEGNGLSPTIVGGLIEAYGEHVVDITGLHVEEGAQVEITPGTHIRASGKDAESVTGLHIGKKETKP